MLSEKKLLNRLIEINEKNGFVLFEDIVELVHDDEDEFDKIIDMLEKHNISIVYDESQIPINLDNDFEHFISNIENDIEFIEFNNQIENELYSKNLDEYIPNISSSDDLVKMYIKEIGPIPLLSMKEEYELSKTVKKGLEAKEKLPFTNIEEDYNSLKQKVLESDEARERLVESNLKLVVSVANSRRKYGIIKSN